MRDSLFLTGLVLAPMLILGAGCSDGPQVGSCIDETCMAICEGRECGPSQFNPDFSCGECSFGTCIDGICHDSSDVWQTTDTVHDVSGRDDGASDNLDIEGDTSGDDLTDDPGPDAANDVNGDVECVPDCGELKCGPDPVCGVSCGECEGLDECREGKCVCQPFTGRQCGDDGCDGSFGECPTDGEICEKGQCVPGGTNTMVTIPAGTFIMGCGVSVTTNCSSDEKPEHSVSISQFQIDKTEVTQAEYLKCVEAGVCDKPACGFKPELQSKRPVVCVSWADAKAYCSWLSKRLPTEAEWEYAARGTVAGAFYPWGTADANCTYANMHFGGEDGCGTGETADVCSLSPKGDSPFGLCDMAGNVWEWVWDFYDAAYYKTSPLQDPQGPATGISHLTRGGGFKHDILGGSGEAAGDVRSINRNKITIDLGTATDTGFRCAR